MLVIINKKFFMNEIKNIINLDGKIDRQYPNI